MYDVFCSCFDDSVFALAFKLSNLHASPSKFLSSNHCSTHLNLLATAAAIALISGLIFGLSAISWSTIMEN